MRAAIAAAALVVISACDSPTDLDGVGAIHTDQRAYQLRLAEWGGLETSIAFTFTNPLNQTVYLARRCHQGFAVTLFKREAEQWVPGVLIPAVDCLGEVVALAPGASVSDRVDVEAGMKGSNFYPQFEAKKIGGLYRLEVWDVYLRDPSKLEMGGRLPLAFRVSNAFRLDAPD